MKPTIHQAKAAYLPTLSSQNRGWENIVVNQYQPPPGEATCYFESEHAIYVSLAPRPVRLLHVKGGKTYTGMYGKGNIAITPADVPLFCRWDSDDHFVEIRITASFIQNVAKETISKTSDQLELLSEFRTRDPQIEAIAMMLLTELKQENQASKLYIDSLANVLAVHLLRQYGTVKLYLSNHEGGLPQRQLLQILDYINEHLNQDTKLADLAQLVGMSQFHFSRLFKQSLGMAPYQYLLQQRIEKAKHLLKQSDRSIMDIAFLCGFNSHSHLSKQFRQVTGMTPKAYRTN
jgi:AraC family transcriptional regulator